MKVVGRGDPRTLTIRLQPCEFGAWRDELARRLEALASEQRGLAPVAAGAFERDPDTSVIVILSVPLGASSDAGGPRPAPRARWADDGTRGPDPRSSRRHDGAIHRSRSGILRGPCDPRVRRVACRTGYCDGMHSDRDQACPSRDRRTRHRRAPRVRSRASGSTPSSKRFLLAARASYGDVAHACGGTDRHARTINQRLIRGEVPERIAFSRPTARSVQPPSAPRPTYGDAWRPRAPIPRRSGVIRREAPLDHSCRGLRHD